MGLMLGWLLVLGALGEDPPLGMLPLGVVPATAPLLQIVTGTEIPWSRVAGAKGTAVVWLSLDCPMARSSLPGLVRLASHCGPQGVALVGVFPAEILPGGDATKKDKAIGALRTRLLELAVTLPVLIDHTGELQRVLEARVTPEAFLLDSRGKALYRGRIDDGYSARLEHRGRVDREDLRLAINEVVAGKPVGVSVTRAYGCALSRPIPARNGSPGVPTYQARVAPILRAHCQVCHQPGALAPFPLTRYEEALRWAEDIRDFTRARRMPPWLPEQSVPLRDCRRLSDEDIQTIGQWVDGGCPEGESAPGTIPAQAVRAPDAWVLGQPDLILDPGADMEIAAEGPDLFRCLVLPTGLKEGRYVTAYEVKPGNQSVVHHMVNYLDNQGRARKLNDKQAPGAAGAGHDRGPGYTFSMGPGFFPLTGDLGGWAPGSTPHRLSPGVGYWLPPGTDVVMQVHYHRTGKAEKDRSRIGLYFAKPAEKITRPFQVIPVGAPFLGIPAGNVAYPVSGKVWLAEDCTLHMLMPHMHLLGKSIRLTVTRPGGQGEILLDIPRWDYNWQEHYFLDKPIALPAGTKLEVEAVFDNSRLNARNPNNPPKMVLVGEGTTNEMCFGFFGLTRDSGGPVGVRLASKGLVLRRLGNLPPQVTP